MQLMPSSLSKHRYNLKRRVASLPPLSSEVFAEKVLTSQAKSSADAAKAAFEKPCTACQKTYYSENAYQNHLGSQKHRLRVAAFQSGDGQVSKDIDAGSVVSSTISLGEPINVPPASIDPEAEAEFAQVVDGVKGTRLDDREPVSRRPTRPHHSANEDRPAHPLSTKNTQTGETLSAAQPGSTPAPKVPLNRCLFCNYDSPAFKLGVLHMTKHHGLFIPEQPYLVDLEGLISFLYSKIAETHECLYCHKIKGSMEGIQTHMRDKGHCMIAFTSEEEMIEVGQFYDFRSSYSDSEPEIESDKADNNATEDATDGGVKLSSRRYRCLKTVISDANGDQVMQDDAEENAGGWETDSSASSLDSAELTAVPIEDRSQAFKRLPLHRHHSHTDPRPHLEADGFHSHAHVHRAVFRDDYELHMPSGRTAGHRSLSRYYRQNLHSYPSATERIERQRMIESARADSDEEMTTEQPPEETFPRGREVATRANGGGLVGVTDAKKREVGIAEKRERKREQRAQKQYEWGVNKRANNQKHFRDPLLQ
ncbi:MAG: hypothetical protein Q9190_003871 [Brigantiaea leucoxantha]